MASEFALEKQLILMQKNDASMLARRSPESPEHPLPPPQQEQQMQISGADWTSQEWLLGEISGMIGALEMSQRAWNLCRAWRRWCNTEMTVLQIGNDFRLMYSAHEVMTPIFLPLVPLNLLELSINGEWIVPSAEELATIRRGCRLRKLVLNGVRFSYFSYWELLQFEHLEELDISDTHMDIKIPCLRFGEPAGEYRVTPAENQRTSLYSKPMRPRGLLRPTPPRVFAATRPLDVEVASDMISWSEGGGFDRPRFARGLRKLVARKTRLWARWNLYEFPLLTALEVSHAGRGLLQQLRREAEIGLGLAELSVCDVALQNLVDAFEMQKLDEALSKVSTFRLQRVDVVKEVANFAYLRAILSRLHNLQVLEMTDVGLDDSMLSVLGDCLFSASAGSLANGGAGGPSNIFTLDGTASASGKRSTASLRTLILGHCGNVSKAAFEEFLCLIGEGGGDRPRVAKSGVGREGNGAGGKDAGRCMDKAGGSGGGGNGTALSCVRLKRCKELGNRGLAALCRGTRGGIMEIEVGSRDKLGSVHVSDLNPVTTVVVLPVDHHNALSFLLAKCPALSVVKAWGVRFVGNPGSGVSVFHPAVVTEACALREAYEKREVELAWAGPIPQQANENGSNCPSSSSIGGGKDGGGGDVEGGSRDGKDEQRDEREPLGERRRKPCPFGCGAILASNGFEDHWEVCPLAPVACLLHLDGCTWTGTRRQRRLHLEKCRMWFVNCPVCCQTVHIREYSEHVYLHSSTSDAPGLHSPGCPLRGYGCCACRTTNLVPTSSSASRNPYELSAVDGVASGLEAFNGKGRGAEVEKEECGKGEGEGKGEGRPEKDGGGGAGKGEGRPKDDGGGGAGAAGLRVHGIESCLYYTLACPSCKRDVSRKEWDEGTHVCLPKYRKINVLAKHTSGAGMLRNRQWLQIAHDYISGAGGKSMADGIDPDDLLEAFHGVNPMCAMPSALSSALPLPGPAGAAASPTTPPP